MVHAQDRIHATVSIMTNMATLQVHSVNVVNQDIFYQHVQQHHVTLLLLVQAMVLVTMQLMAVTVTIQLH